MTNNEVINQLENLKCHCEDMARCSDSDSDWNKDVKALEVAIEALKGTAQEVPVQEQLDEKIRFLVQKHGFNRVTNEFLNELKANDPAKYLKVNYSIALHKAKGKKVILVHFFRNTFSVYSESYISGTQIEKIIYKATSNL